MVHFSLTSVAFFLGAIAASASTVHSRDGMSHKRASSIKTEFTDGKVSVYHPSLYVYLQYSAFFTNLTDEMVA